jgi:hypothetical protein
MTEYFFSIFEVEILQNFAIKKSLYGRLRISIFVREKLRQKVKI